MAARTVLVSGASSGLGRATAQALAATRATIIVHAFIPYYERTGHWKALAWWVHDHLAYSSMLFFPKFAAFNLGSEPLARKTVTLGDKTVSGKEGADTIVWLATLPATGPSGGFLRNRQRIAW